MERSETTVETLTLPDGRQLAFRQFGDPGGRPLVALHGTPASSLIMQLGDGAARRRGLRLIAPDRPGYGGSSVWPGYRHADWTGDMEFLLDHLKVPHFLLLGVSGGGPFACALAAHLPLRVDALALVSPVGPIGAGDRLLPAQRLFFDLLPRHPRLRRLLLASVRPLMQATPGLVVTLAARTLGAADRQMLGERRHRALVRDAMTDGLRMGLAGIDDDLRLFASIASLPFERIEAPSILWLGQHDRLVPPCATISLHRRIKGSRLVELPDAGHFWVLNHVGEVLDALIAQPGSRR